jgi:hypothetical protein
MANKLSFVTCVDVNHARWPNLITTQIWKKNTGASDAGGALRFPRPCEGDGSIILRASQGQYRLRKPGGLSTLKTRPAYAGGTDQSNHGNSILSGYLSTIARILNDTPEH